MLWNVFRKKQKIEKIRCDTCGFLKTKEELHKVMDAFYLCRDCVDNILRIYIYNSPVKSLCPSCENDEEICLECNTELLFHKLKTGE